MPYVPSAQPVTVAELGRIGDTATAALREAKAALETGSDEQVRQLMGEAAGHLQRLAVEFPRTVEQDEFYERPVTSSLAYDALFLGQVSKQDEGLSLRARRKKNLALDSERGRLYNLRHASTFLNAILTHYASRLGGAAELVRERADQATRLDMETFRASSAPGTQTVMPEFLDGFVTELAEIILPGFDSSKNPRFTTIDNTDRVRTPNRAMWRARLDSMIGHIEAARAMASKSPAERLENAQLLATALTSICSVWKAPQYFP
jgi:hypothetical protein